MKEHGKVSAMDILKRYNLLLKCNLHAELINAGIPYKKALKLTKNVIEGTGKRYMADIKKYDTGLYAVILKRNIDCQNS